MVSSKILTMTTPPLTAVDFRRALGQFATGVTVVTAQRGPGQVYGMTANSFTSVSLEPFLILVCIDLRSKMHALLPEKGRFGISVLKQGQQAISEYFAQTDQSSDKEPELGIAYRWLSSGVPVLENTLLQLNCKLCGSRLSGDHTIFLGEVESAEMFPGEPLLYFRGDYRQIAGK
jgi:flavin reductase (DIM6/NTAB) family NADH-FMN oxidoreductase RutF